MPFPPPAVLAAFGVAGSRPVPLGGGQGMSWSAGDVVFKPVDVDDLEEIHEWQYALEEQI